MMMSKIEERKIIQTLIDIADNSEYSHKKRVTAKRYANRLKGKKDDEQIAVQG